jgi:DNA-binding NtrC family response regulator
MKMVSNLEKKWILLKLKETDWNQGKAAKLLGVTRKMLSNRISKYNLQQAKKMTPKQKFGKEIAL